MPSEAVRHFLIFGQAGGNLAMQKLTLVVCLLALTTSAANLGLLYVMTSTIKESHDKLEPVLKEVEKLKPMMKNLADKMENLPHPGKQADGDGPRRPILPPGGPLK